LNVLKLAALLVASATALAASAATATSTSTDKLVSNSSWWERVTVTLDGDGSPEACRYETSLSPSAAEPCDVDSGQAAMAKHASAKGEVTRITFERRFTPGEAPAKPDLQVGDTLLGGQVMSLAIDQHGSVKGCEIVAASGAMRPDYGCSDAQAEKFQASVGGTQGAEQKQGYMTILVYGHSEHMV
jgi:hypothetical protein